METNRHGQGKYFQAASLLKRFLIPVMQSKHLTDEQIVHGALNAILFSFTAESKYLDKPELTLYNALAEKGLTINPDGSITFTKPELETIQPTGVTKDEIQYVQRTLLVSGRQIQETATSNTNTDKTELSNNKTT